MNFKNRKFWQYFFFEALLFSLTLFLGIFSAKKVTEIYSIQNITFSETSPFDFILGFIFATFCLLLIIYFLKNRKAKGKIFKIVFLTAAFLGSIVFFGTFFPEPISFMLVFLLIFWWLKSPTILNQNLLMILGTAGIGSILGLRLRPEFIVFLLIAFSIYDFIAVYKTKHMVKMAKEMIEHQAILGIVIPPKISGFRENLQKVQPGGEFVILGGGDIVFPLLLSVSLVPGGVLKSLIVSLFALIGLLFSFYIFAYQKARQPIPALPPIALFSIIGYFLTRFLK